jgi:putative salt-induced outer membrane protein
MRHRYLICLLLLPAPAFAQAPANPPPPVVSGKAALSFVDAAGNSRAQTLGVSGEVTYHPDGWTGTAQAEFDRATTDGLVSAESATGELRGSRRLTKRIEGYLQTDYLKNRFAGISSRIAVSSGIAWTLTPAGASQRVELDSGLGYSHQVAPDHTTQAFATGNVGVQYRWRLSKTATLTDGGLFTGSLQSAADWRVTNTVAVSAAINSVFSLKLSHRLDFVNQPVPTFLKLDQLTSASLVASF